jgi:hypothetical protein
MELPAMYTCPCCSYRVFADAPGSYDICPICFWEDDIVQLAFPGLAGGANKCSLFEGQQNFEKIGACEERIKAYVRPAKDTDLRDSEWRPLDMGCDQFLKWENREDHQTENHCACTTGCRITGYCINHANHMLLDLV